ncbi:MAG TPA: YncE family protein [Actinomycetota bacterium]|nr:YncE family protein [Actinomycetota bacterium]
MLVVALVASMAVVGPRAEAGAARLATFPVADLEGWGVAVDSAANRLYVSHTPTSRLLVLDPSTGATINSLPVGRLPHDVLHDPASARIYVANYYGDSVSVISSTTFATLATIPVGSAPHNLALNPRTQRLYVTMYGSAAIGVVDTGTLSTVGTVGVGGTPYEVAVDESRNVVYVARSGGLTVVNGANQVIRSISLGYSPTGLGYDPVSDGLFVSDWQADSVHALDAATLAPRATIQVQRGPASLVIQPETHRAYVLHRGSGSLSVIDTATMTAVQSLSLGFDPTGVAVDPTNQHVYVGRRDNIDKFTEDDVAPDTSFVSSPGRYTSSASASFAFAGADDLSSGAMFSYQCRFGSAPFSACSSPVAISGLQEGTYTFEVRARDKGGNVDPSPALHTWTVDGGRPASGFLTSRDSVLINAGSVASDAVQGTASDALSGIADVSVTFHPDTPGGQPFTGAVEISCLDEGRQNCSWRSNLPGRPGGYSVHAVARDRAGNLELPGPVTRVIVLGAAPRLLRHPSELPQH